MNQKEQVFLNSCELILQQFSIRQKGSIYFVWKKGKKHTQSLKYQCSQQIIPMKETLSLSLKTYSINGQMQKRYTHFSLFDGDGREIDHVKFDVTEWKGDSTQKKIVLGTCNLRIRVKRRIALQLQNFHRHSKTEIQESQSESDRQAIEGVRVQRKQQLSIKEELAKARRELQDFDFMTSKLKNDRNFYISENETLRHKLESIHEEYGEQIARLKNHYDTRIEIRESIYQQEIQELISTFNQNYEINRALIEGLVHEKYEYETEISEMKEMHQNYIEKQEDNYEGIISSLEQNKRAIEEEIKDLLNKLSDRENTITELQRTLTETNFILDQTKDELNKEIEQHAIDNEKWEREIEQREMIIYKKGEEIEAMKIQIDTKEFQLKENQDALVQYRTLIAQFQKSVIQKQNEIHQIEAIRYNLTLQIERLKSIVEQKVNQLQIQKVSIQHLNEQDKMKELEHQSQYRIQETLYNQKQMMYMNKLKSEQESLVEISKENYNHKIQIQQLENDLVLANGTIGMLKNDNQQILDLGKQLREEIRQMSEANTKQNLDYNQQYTNLMTEKTFCEAENHALRDQINQLERKIQVDTANLKRDYEDLVESKTKLHEDQLDFLKTQRDADVDNFEKIKRQYENEIASLVQRETRENQELQKLFRDQLELKNKEFLELKENYNLMQQTYDDLKLRLEIAEEERNNLKKGRKKTNFDQHIQIQQIQEETDEISEEQSEEEEEKDSESSQDQKKKKNKKGKNQKNDKNDKKSKEKKKLKQKQKQKEKNKKKGKDLKLKNKKNKKVTSSESQQQSSEPRQLSEQDPSQILATVQDDDFYNKKKKNLVKSNEVNAGSQKMIPLQSEQQKPGQRQNVFLPQVISIQVPADGPYYETKEQKSERSEGSKKKRRQSFVHNDTVQNQKLLKAEGQVKQLQKQIKKLKKQIKDHERNQTMYLAQIEEQQEQIRNLNTEMDNLVKKVSKKDPKLAKNITAQLEEKRQEKSNSNKSRSEISMKAPPIPRKEMENMKMENEYLKRTVQEKNRSLANLDNEKNAYILKLQALQSAKSELERRFGIPQSYQQPSQPNVGVSSTFQLQQGLKRSVLQLQGKFMSEKQKAQQTKLQLNKTTFQKEQLQIQNKKLKTKLEELEEHIKKNQPTQSQREMQKQLEDYNRQFMDISKSLNSERLEKQAFEEELRLMKKRYSQIIRASQQAETKATNLEREVEDLRRKDNRSRRDIEDYTEQINKYKDQVKQLQIDMNSLNTLQSQSVYERKKVMDQIIKREDALSTKEFEVVKLTKQIQKLKQKLQQGDDLKLNKRNQLLQQRQRLESLLIKSEKRVKQLEQQDRLLKQRIQILERENKTTMDDKKQTYGQKLRFYVEEISSIKHIVDEYQNQNSRLKIQNSQLFEHNQILKITFEKLQARYEQLVQNENQLLQQRQQLQNDIDTTVQTNNQQKLEIQAANITITNLRKQIDTERIVSKKKSDKLTAYEQLNEKYLYEIKTLRIKLSQFQTNLNENQLLTEKYQNNTKTIEQLENELKILQEEYTHTLNTYTYRKEDVEQAMKELKEHEEKIKEEEITRVIEELDSTHSQKQASMEQEIIELFNENSKLRLTLQQKNDENAEFLNKISQTENLPQKLKTLQNQRDSYQRSVYQLSEQLKTVSEELRRADSKLNESIRNQQGKNTENVLLSKKYEQVDRKYKELSDAFGELKREEKKLLQRIKLIHEDKQKQLDKQRSDIQHYQNKILSLELQLNRVKEMESGSSKEYVKKIKKLQQKIQEMNDTFRQHQQSLEGHYLAEIKKLEQSLQKLSQELEEKLHRIQELNQALIMLQGQNQDLIAQLTSARTQIAHEGESYTNDINNLRNQLRQAELIYDSNIKTLQEEMSSLSKELTQLRYNRQNGSRLSGSGVVDDKTSKRYEEKIRLRDKRIEELKCQILAMEESLTKLMRKQSTTENLSQAQMDKLRLNLNNTESQLNDLRRRYDNDISMLNESTKSLKRQIMEWRNKVEERELTLEEKQLQVSSIKVELKTTKQLYSQLQQQLQKRKTHLNNQIDEQSQLQGEIRIKNLRINELVEKLDQTNNDKLKIQAELKRKSLQSKRLIQRLNQVQINYKDILNHNQRKTAEIRTIKQTLRETEDKYEKVYAESNKLKNQMVLWQKENHQLKYQRQTDTTLIAQLKQKLESNNGASTHSEQYARKYHELDTILQQELNMNLEQYCNSDYWNQRLNQKDNDIQVLAEELEELRFLFEHKNLQLDELKKIQYELHIKTEDNQFIYAQLHQLRTFCSNLQEEKKNAVFREQALKLQLQNLIESQDRNNVTLKLENILQGCIDV